MGRRTTARRPERALAGTGPARPSVSARTGVRYARVAAVAALFTDVYLY
ncbi:hypothetical protein ABT168_04155 [Streptomyces sp. NPDC001793]